MSNTTENHTTSRLNRPVNQSTPDQDVPTPAGEVLVVHVDDMTTRALDRAVENLDLVRVAIANGQGPVARELLAEAVEDLAEARHWITYL